MPSKDYKDALNDIRLSSEFCAKMEEKLSKDIFEDDEYEEVENHVEVIEHKGFRKYMAAAAVIAVIGAVGGGGFLRFKSDFSSIEQYGIESEVEEETSEAENDSTEKIFDFPFASIDLSGLTFIYHQTGYVNQTAVTISSAEMADQLIAFFSQVDWTETEMGYNTLKLYDEDDEEAEALTIAIDSELGNEKISFNSYRNGKNCNVSILSSGSITVNSSTEESDFAHISYYEMGPGQFSQLKNLLFSMQKEEYIEFADIRANIVGAKYSMDKGTGIITAEQAALLANCFNRGGWETDTDLYERPIESPITLYLSGDDYDYKVELYSIGLAFVTNYNSQNENSSQTQKNYRFASIFYSDIKKILTGEQDIDCPVNISYMENAVIQLSEGGKCTSYALDKDDLIYLQSILRQSKWTTELFSQAMISFSMAQNLCIKDDNSVFYIDVDGYTIYYNKNTSEEVYRINKDDFKKLTSEVAAMSKNKTLLSDTDIVQRGIEKCLSGDTVHFVDTLSDYPISGDDINIPTEVLREVFEGTEWKALNMNSGDTNGNTSSYATAMINTKFQIINTDSSDNMIMLSKDGYYIDLLSFCIYESSDSARIAEQLDQLYKEYRK